jgi:hypothetical protein
MNRKLWEGGRALSKNGKYEHFRLSPQDFQWIEEVTFDT